MKRKIGKPRESETENWRRKGKQGERVLRLGVTEREWEEKRAERESSSTAEEKENSGGKKLIAGKEGG